MTDAPAGPPGDGEARPASLVWIDAREAIIVRWRAGTAQVERIESDVPAHRRTTGHVRHDPLVRHGGGGSPQTAGEPHRLEHLRRHVERTATRLPPHDDLLILGPGTVRERLERLVREADERRGSQRTVESRAAARLTERQLIARLRRFNAEEPRRTTVGAYRWSEPGPPIPGRGVPGPRRVGAKRRRKEWGEP